VEPEELRAVVTVVVGEIKAQMFLRVKVETGATLVAVEAGELMVEERPINPLRREVAVRKDRKEVKAARLLYIPVGLVVIM
jgi:hypothetical protein